MPNVNNNSTLDTAARSDPRDNRLILSYVENGMRIVEVMDCVDVGDLTAWAEPGRKEIKRSDFTIKEF